VKTALLDFTSPTIDPEALALGNALAAPVVLANVRAAELPGWWREAILDRDEFDDPGPRAVYAALLLLVCAARSATLTRAQIDEELVATIITAACFGLALEVLRGDYVIGDYSGDGLGSVLALFVERNAVPA
jgi:hypothetical protein